MLTNYLLLLGLMVMFGYQIYTVKRYKKLDKNRESYVATVTHDLKSPTRAQINILNMLLKEEFGKLNQKQQELLKLTCGSTKYMSNLVGNILTKYECDCSKFRLNYSKFNICELANNVLKANEWLSLEKEQKIVLNFSENIFVSGDKLEIERVIFNLLSNAITYGIKKTIISVEIVHVEDKVNFIVKNKGYPMRYKDFSNLFTKFGRAKNSYTNPSSTGLGLYVSKQIIEMHRGKMIANMTNNGLYTFGFSIPCVNNELSIQKV